MKGRGDQLHETLDGRVLVEALAPARIADHSNPPGPVKPFVELGKEERPLRVGQARTLRHAPAELDPSGGAVHVLAARAPRGGGVKGQFAPGNDEGGSDLEGAVGASHD